MRFWIKVKYLKYIGIHFFFVIFSGKKKELSRAEKSISVLKRKQYILLVFGSFVKCKLVSGTSSQCDQIIHIL
jgi:hypothetical protein